MKTRSLRASLLGAALLASACSGGGTDSPDGGPPPGLAKTSLGSVSIDPTAGADVKITVPENAGWLEVVAANAGDNLVTVSKITGPGGATFYDGTDHHFRVNTTDDLFTLLVPTAPQISLAKGDYTLHFTGAKSDGSDLGAALPVDATLLINTSSPGAKFDVNLYFVGAGISDGSGGSTPLTAASAKDNAQFQAMFNRAKAILQQKGMDFGTVAYLDADASAAASLSTIDSLEGPNSKLAQLLKLGSGSGAVLNLYFVDQILDTAADPANPPHVLGISPGVPGPATLFGTSRSGVAVETVNLGASPTKTAQTMVHEMLHFMGLFHTSERYVDERYNTDPLDDTPECPKSQDGATGTAPNGQLGARECHDFDSNNLMFWAGVQDDGNVWPVDTLPVITDNQATVVRKNPLAK